MTQRAVTVKNFNKSRRKTAKMKKYEAIRNEIAKASDEKKKVVISEEFTKRLKDIASNEAVTNLQAITFKEAMYLLQYEQFAKAFTNKKYMMTLDINYEATRSEAINLHISTLLDTANKRVLHFYSHDSFIDIVISSNKATKAKLDYVKALNEYFTIDDKKKYETVIKRVAFDDIVKAVDFAKLILETSAEDLQKMLEAKQSAEA